jgi:hypothetical protein
MATMEDLKSEIASALGRVHACASMTPSACKLIYECSQRIMIIKESKINKEGNHLTPSISVSFLLNDGFMSRKDIDVGYTLKFYAGTTWPVANERFEAFLWQWWLISHSVLYIPHFECVVIN